LLDGGDHLVRKVGVGAAEIEMKFDLCWHLSVSMLLSLASPGVVTGSQIHLMRPARAALLGELKVDLGDRLRIEDAVAVLEGGALGKVAADEFRIDGAIDHHMGDLNALRPKFARQALRQCAQTRLGAGKGAIAAAPAQ